MASTEAMAFRSDEDLSDRIKQFQKRAGLEKQSDAVERLVRAGLREQETALLIGWKENAVQATHYLMVAGVVMAALGIAPGVFSMRDGVLAAGSLVIVGLGLLAAVELARALAGQSKLGATLRGESA